MGFPVLDCTLHGANSERLQVARYDLGACPSPFGERGRSQGLECEAGRRFESARRAAL